MESLTTDHVEIEIILDGEPALVWKAWTDPVTVLKWFGSDPKGWGIFANMDVRTGGVYQICFEDSDHTEHTCSGVYQKVEINRLLEFTWTWKSEPGVETIVLILLNLEGNKTRMAFRHSNLGSKSIHNYLQGWKDTFIKLEAIISNLKP